MLPAAEGNCRASGSRLPSPGGSSALSPVRRDPGTTGEGAAPAAPFIPCTRCPARPRSTLRGARGEELGLRRDAAPHFALLHAAVGNGTAQEAREGGAAT